MSTSQASATARHARPPDCSHPSAPPKLAVSRAPAASRPTHGRRPSRRSSSAGRPSTSCSGATPFSAMTSRTTQRAFRKRLPGSGRPTRKAATVIRALSSRFATATLGVALALSGFVVAACGSDDSSSSTHDATDTTDSAGDAGGDAAEPVIDPGDGGDYQPDIDPANFVDVIDNRYLPYAPGSSWTYEGTDDGETEQIEVVVTDERREVMGISAVVVRDTVTMEGALVEDTYDWFAQDRDGNVWYLGEETAEHEDGQVVSTEGSWEAGVDGALPGIVMPAQPAVGEEKYFAPGVGLVLEVKTAGGEGRVELLEHTPGG